MTTDNPYEPPFVQANQANAAPKQAPLLATRRVLWVHVAAVTCITVFMSRAGGDLHAIHPPALYVLAIPAIYSLFLIPPLIAYTLFREKNIWSLSLLAELIVAFVHYIVVSSGFSSY